MPPNPRYRNTYNRVQTRQLRKEHLSVRAKVVDPTAGRCIVLECNAPKRAATSNGFGRRFCRAHEEFERRHGSAYKTSYTAAQLNPYRRAAVEWLIANEVGDIWADNAVARVRTLYQNAGPYREATSLRGQPPRERANAAWARLRRFEVDPRLVVAAVLGVEMTVADDRQAVSANEYKVVQIAKVIHRLASGTHKHWPLNKVTPELHKYPMSRGNVLRYIGADAMNAVGLLSENRLPQIRQFAVARQRITVAAPKAKPASISGRKRSTKSALIPSPMWSEPKLMTTAEQIAAQAKKMGLVITHH